MSNPGWQHGEVHVNINRLSAFHRVIAICQDFIVQIRVILVRQLHVALESYLKHDIEILYSLERAEPWEPKANSTHRRAYLKWPCSILLHEVKRGVQQNTDLHLVLGKLF